MNPPSELRCREVSGVGRTIRLNPQVHMKPKNYMFLNVYSPECNQPATPHTNLNCKSWYIRATVCSPAIVHTPYRTGQYKLRTVKCAQFWKIKFFKLEKKIKSHINKNPLCTGKFHISRISSQIRTGVEGKDQNNINVCLHCSSLRMQYENFIWGLFAGVISFHMNFLYLLIAIRGNIRPISNLN